MTKEELLEMVNATITGNGKQEITGQSLNLALTEIINAMGTGSGGGGLIVHYLPRDIGTQWVWDDSGNFTIQDLLNDSSINFPYREQLQKCVGDNINTFNTLMDCVVNKTPIPGPIYFDTTFFELQFNNRSEYNAGTYGGCATYWYADINQNVVRLQNNIRGDGTTEELYLDGLLGQFNSPSNERTRIK